MVLVGIWSMVGAALLWPNYTEDEVVRWATWPWFNHAGFLAWLLLILAGASLDLSDFAPSPLASPAFRKTFLVASGLLFVPSFGAAVFTILTRGTFDAVVERGLAATVLAQVASRVCLDRTKKKTASQRDRGF